MPRPQRAADEHKKQKLMAIVRCTYCSVNGTLRSPKSWLLRIKKTDFLSHVLHGSYFKPVDAALKKITKWLADISFPTFVIKVLMMGCL